MKIFIGKEYITDLCWKELFEKHVLANPHRFKAGESSK